MIGETGAEHNDKRILQKPVKIDGLCRSYWPLDLSGVGFYKDVAPTALENCTVIPYGSHAAEAQAVTTDALVKYVLNDVLVR
jgi:hypothetical protein